MVTLEDEPDLPASLIRPDGSRFDNDIAAIEAALAALENPLREVFRDRNASDIAQHPATHLLIVAGPGSGKSTLFLARIKHWLPVSTDSRIYVSSFVRKLVKDLRADIDNKARLSADDQGRVTVTTLHHLARSLLASNRGTAAQPLGHSVHVIAGEWEDIVWGDVLAFHADLKASSFSRQRMARQFFTEEFDPSADWQAVVARYLQLGRFYSAVGFADMIVLAREAIDENPELNAHTHWIVDEFQDFNAAEVHLLRSVTASAAGVLIAGDDEQALYEYSKASLPAIILSYYDDQSFANAMLPYCSRCSYYICLAASTFIANKRSASAIPKVYLPLKEEKSAARVRVVGTAHPSTEVAYIEEFVEAHRSELNDYKAKMEAGDETDPYLLILTPKKDLSFLGASPTKRLRGLVGEWADAQNRPSPDYWRTAAYAAVGWTETNNYAVRQVLHHEGVPSETVHVLLEQALSGNRSLIGVLEKAYDPMRARAAAVAALCEAPHLSSEDKARAIAEVLSISDIASLARDLQAHPLDLFWAIEGDEANEVIETAGAMAPVELLSLVGSKGLSAHHVIVIGCDDVNLNLTSRLAFFVALTRARQSLHLITSLKSGGSKDVHPYVLELPRACCEYVIKVKAEETVLPSAQAFARKLGAWQWGFEQNQRAR